MQLDGLYLVAFIARGEECLGVARRCTAENGWGTPSDPAPWWMLAPGGWRVRPFWTRLLAELIDGEQVPPAPPGAIDAFPGVRREEPASAAERRSEVDASDLGL